jgi:hypothetical protein
MVNLKLTKDELAVLIFSVNDIKPHVIFWSKECTDAYNSLSTKLEELREDTHA